VDVVIAKISVGQGTPTLLYSTTVSKPHPFPSVGDSINLRGYSASNDLTVDNVRDSAQYSRSDPFDLEQIEVTNGANSVYSGAGGVGGTINIVSKRPGRRDGVTLTAGAGTDSYRRATIDATRIPRVEIAARIAPL